IHIPQSKSLDEGGQEALEDSRVPIRLRRALRPVSAQCAGDYEADAGALVVDRAGLVVDQAQALREGDERHLVEGLLVSPLSGVPPQVAGVADPWAVGGE